MKHKVGDRVRIRKDLVRGQKYGEYDVTSTMQELGGKTACITDVNVRNEAYHIDLDLDLLYWTDEMFENVDTEVQKMHKSVTINVVGNKVNAYCDGKIGVARCHPDDTFDFFVGAKIALERLEEAEKPYGWLKNGMRYYIPSVDCIALYDSYVYDANEWNNRFVECAKKMLAAIKQEG